MQNLLTAQQIKDVDAYSIKHQPIKSIELMENASKAFVKIFKKHFSKGKQISIFCGQGNNGGDGLAIARLLGIDGYENITVYLVRFSERQSDEFLVNLDRLQKTKIKILELEHCKYLKTISADVVIDAILGAGLNKPLAGEYEKLVKQINACSAEIVAVDIPTGLPAEGQIGVYNGVNADLTISFQLPKINFFFPESIKAQKRFQVVNIGLDENYIHQQETIWKTILEKDIVHLLKPRENFSYKGTFGHVLLVAGNQTTMGAAILSASGCLHAGAGLTTVCLPQSGLIALNTTLPEVMALPRNCNIAQEAFEKFNVVGFGPGVGHDTENETLLERFIDLKKSMVIDADGLGMLAKRQDLIIKLPGGTIITPHMKEFDRIFGTHQSWWERVKTANAKAKELDIVIVLKNQYTFVCLPNGEICINQTGNPAMASGGMGDVLTGIISAFAAQGYTASEAAILGVYLHGKTGDHLAFKNGVVVAGQLAVNLPKTLKKMQKKIRSIKRAYFNIL